MPAHPVSPTAKHKAPAGKHAPGKAGGPAGAPLAHPAAQGLGGLPLAEQKARVAPKEHASGQHHAAAQPADGQAGASQHELHHPFRYSGEPLPFLKEILQGKLRPSPKANLAAFLDMVGQAKVRPGTKGARTFTSPADGLAAIITGVVLSIVDKYQHVASPAQKAVLERVTRDHLKLLETPMGPDGKTGGHRVVGVKGEGKGLAGPALSHGAPARVETVNQTAVVLLGLQRLVEDPLSAGQHPRIQKLLDQLVPEFKASVVQCYSGPNVRKWKYGLSGRPEDQSHLKTSWDQMRKLGKTQSKHAAWFAAQADRIERLWPRATGPWEGLSNQAGSLG